MTYCEREPLSTVHIIAYPLEQRFPNSYQGVGNLVSPCRGSVGAREKRSNSAATILEHLVPAIFYSRGSKRFGAPMCCCRAHFKFAVIAKHSSLPVCTSELCSATGALCNHMRELQGGCKPPGPLWT